MAHEGRNTLAMLVRRKVETLAQLLTRLDLAIAQAQTDDVFTDEVTRQAFTGPNIRHRFTVRRPVPVLAGKWSAQMLSHLRQS